MKRMGQAASEGWRRVGGSGQGSRLERYHSWGEMRRGKGRKGERREKNKTSHPIEAHPEHVPVCDFGVNSKGFCRECYNCGQIRVPGKEEC